MAELIKEALDRLGTVFRYVLPGVIIVGCARLSHPKWFTAVNLDNSNHFWALVVVTIAVGNLWYVLHRELIHQLLDYVFFRLFKSQGPWCCATKWCKCRCCPSLDWYGYLQFVKGNIEGFHNASPDLRSHFERRSSQFILFCILVECLFIFGWTLDENDSPLRQFWKKHPGCVTLVPIGLTIFAIVQYGLVWSLGSRLFLKTSKNENSGKEN